MDKLREMEINPAILIGVLVLIVGGFAYAFWLRPSQEAAQAKANWTTPEAAAARAPGGRKDPEYERKVQQLREKERNTRPVTQRRE